MLLPCARLYSTGTRAYERVRRCVDVFAFTAADDTAPSDVWSLAHVRADTHACVLNTRSSGFKSICGVYWAC